MPCKTPVTPTTPYAPPKPRPAQPQREGRSVGLGYMCATAVKVFGSIVRTAFPCKQC